MEINPSPPRCVQSERESKAAENPGFPFLFGGEGCGKHRGGDGRVKWEQLHLFPTPLPPQPLGGTGPPSPPQLLWGQSWLLLTVQLATEWQQTRSETCDTFPSPGPLECQLCPGTPTPGRSFVEGDSQPGLGQGGGKGSSPRVWLLSEVTQCMPWLGGTVMCPCVTETLTLLRTRVARVALGNEPSIRG